MKRKEFPLLMILLVIAMLVITIIPAVATYQPIQEKSQALLNNEQMTKPDITVYSPANANTVVKMDAAKQTPYQNWTMIKGPSRIAADQIKHNIDNDVGINLAPAFFGTPLAVTSPTHKAFGQVDTFVSDQYQYRIFGQVAVNAEKSNATATAKRTHDDVNNANKGSTAVTFSFGIIEVNAGYSPSLLVATATIRTNADKTGDLALFKMSETSNSSQAYASELKGYTVVAKDQISPHFETVVVIFKHGIVGQEIPQNFSGTYSAGIASAA